MNKFAGLASLLILLSLFIAPAYGNGPSAHLLEVKGQAPALVLPIVKRDSLLNGLQIILIEKQGTGSVTAHLRINSGAIFDLAGKGGLADITSGMLLRGGGGLDARNVTETVEQLGLTINILTGWDSTDIIVSGPADSLDNIFDLLRRLVITPAFDQKELDAVKALRVAATKAEVEDNADAVRRKALELTFGSHPFGRPVRGTPESIAQITRNDLQYFHKRFYIANNSELIVTGDATADVVTRLARTRLGAWSKGEVVPASFRAPELSPTRKIVILDRPGSQVADGAIAQIGISRRSNDYFAGIVMGEVLAGMNSNLSEKTGAAIKTELDPRIIAGPILIGFKSPPDSVAETINGVISNMTAIRNGQIPVDHIERAKAKILAAFAEQLRTPEGAAGAILDIELYGLGRDYLINFADRVNAITPNDVTQAARNYLKPDLVAVVIAAPAQTVEGPLKRFGNVSVAH